ncbi:MAG: pyridoxal 5'-phosphate synthase glutaminase subunit PdxT [Dehalococcoidia bacterium]
MTTKGSNSKAVGVLAIQGDFAEHIAVLRDLAVEAREVRLPPDLDQVQALIIPGGESTTIGRLMEFYGLREVLVRRAHEGMPLWGTCAGLILMAQRISENRPQPLGLLDIDVVRNAYGRQVDSFEAEMVIPPVGAEPFRGVFIRAPIISRVGQGVEVLGCLADGQAVAVRQGNLLGTAFHPELTPDVRFHRYFLSMLQGS